MKIKNTINKVLYKFGIRTNEVEALRKRGVKIGNNVKIVRSNIDSCQGFLITIGNNVTITHSTVLAHDASTKNYLGYSKVGRVDIGDDVFIGYGSIVLPNTKIGNKVIVGAGTVVAKDVPDNVVIVGNPFRIICTFDEYIERNRAKLEKGPVYHTYWPNKTQEEKDRMYIELKDTGGYDI